MTSLLKAFIPSTETRRTGCFILKSLNSSFFLSSRAINAYYVSITRSINVFILFLMSCFVSLEHFWPTHPSAFVKSSRRKIWTTSKETRKCTNNFGLTSAFAIIFIYYQNGGDHGSPQLPLIFVYITSWSGSICLSVWISYNIFNMK